MKIQKIKAIAKAKGIEAGNMQKAELIRMIQRQEGNFDCYGSANAGSCDQTDCLWRGDCLQASIQR